MAGSKEVTYDAINSFIIAIKCWYALPHAATWTKSGSTSRSTTP